MQISDPTPAGHPALNERTQHLLKFLVERYIRDGQPVGSRTLARDAGLDLSSATVRNVMADLEDLGYLRAPSHLGRSGADRSRLPAVFIDTLLQRPPLDHRGKSKFCAGGSISRCKTAPSWRGRYRTCCPE
jgi:heat-inducible transcriptional repressor